jgi:hypothetical protein
MIVGFLSLKLLFIGLLLILILRIKIIKLILLHNFSILLHFIILLIIYYYILLTIDQWSTYLWLLYCIIHTLNHLIINEFILLRVYDIRPKLILLLMPYSSLNILTTFLIVKLYRICNDILIFLIIWYILLSYEFLGRLRKWINVDWIIGNIIWLLLKLLINLNNWIESILKIIV